MTFTRGEWRRRHYTWRRREGEEPSGGISRRTVPASAWEALLTPLTEAYDGQGAAAEPPAGHQEAWGEALAFALAEVLAAEEGGHPGAVRRWRLLFLLPRMLLPEGLDAEESTDLFLDRLDHFWAGRWGELVPTPPGDRVGTPAEGDWTAGLARAEDLGAPGPTPRNWEFLRGRASYLLGKGDKSRTRRLLVSPGMAPRSEASYWGLWAHHPPAPRGYRVAEL